jgi:lysozyme
VGNCSRRPPAAEVRTELDDFLAIVESAWGRPALLYVGNEFEDPYPVRARDDRPLWHRRFLRRPNVDDWVVWQLHGQANVEGVRGRVDINVARAGWSGQSTGG